MAKSKYFINTWNKIEHLPQWPMLGTGVFMGLIAGLISLFVIGQWQGVMSFVVLLTVALFFGLVASPVVDSVIEKTDDTPEPEPIKPLLEMVLIPAGNFIMGSKKNNAKAYDSEFPAHIVKMSNFLMSQATVTRDIYIKWMKEIPGSWSSDESDKLPANDVSWLDAVHFCNVLSEKQALEPCYNIENKQVTWNREANGYRLPTEAEWEYAARAYTTTHWCFGDDEKLLKKYAWYDKSSKNKVHKVMQLLPNDYGLYDMHGNVWEWVWDWYGDYQSKSQDNPIGPETGQYRCLRGGSARSAARRLRSSGRRGVQTEIPRQIFGFRCVRAPAASFDRLNN